MTETDLISYVKNTLVSEGFDAINESGYEALIDSHMINNIEQAKSLIAIVKDISTTGYNLGYSDGRVFQGKADQKEVDEAKAEAKQAGK